MEFKTRIPGAEWSSTSNACPEPMHERSIVRALLKQVRQLQTEQGAEGVVAVKVSVGEFSGVEADLLRSAFDEMVNGSPFCGARLELQQVPLESRCQSCSSEFAVENFRFRCPRCGGSHVETIRGEGLILESVTLEFGRNDERHEPD